MIVCPICPDDISTREAVACPCGHVFHSNCLFRWFATSHTCPECRRFANAEVILNLFFNTAPVDVDPRQLEAEVATLKEALANLQAKYDKESAYVETLEDRVATYGNKWTELIDNNDKSLAKIHELEQTGRALCCQLRHFHNIQKLLYCGQSELESILDSITRESDVLKNMLNYSSVLEKQLSDMLKPVQTQECKMETDSVPTKDSDDIPQSKEEMKNVEGECSHKAESPSSSDEDANCAKTLISPESPSSSEDTNDSKMLAATGSPSNESSMLPDSSSLK